MLSVAYSPDGRRLACGAMDGTVAVFDVPSGKLLHTLTGHHKPVRGLSFTPGACRPLTLVPPYADRPPQACARSVVHARHALPTDYREVWFHDALQAE